MLKKYVKRFNSTIIVLVIAVVLAMVSWHTASSAEQIDPEYYYVRPVLLPWTLEEYRQTHPNRSYIFSSAGDEVTVSVTVLPNLSLRNLNGEPVYATNHPLGATLHIDDSQKPYIYWTVTADY